MNSSNLETKQAPEGRPRGRGRGRGLRGRSQNQCDSPRNSPTASRRPAQALYSPGAFSKHRNNDQAVESPENVRTKNTVPKSLIKTEPVHEKSEISISEQVDKSNARDQEDCEFGLEDNGDKRNNISEDEKSFENDFNKSYVSSPTSNSVEHGSRDVKKNNSSSPTDITSKRIDHADVTDVVVSESQPDCIDSNCDNVTNSLQSRDNVGQTNRFDCSANSNVHNEIMSEKCEKQEEICTTFEDTLLEDTCETIQTNDHTKLNCGKTSKKAIQVEVPITSSESSDSKIFPNKSSGSEKSMNESKEKGNASKEGVEERINVMGDERQLAETKVEDTVDSVTERLGTNTACMADRESYVNIHDNKTNVEDSVDVSGCIKSVSVMSDITEEEMPASSQALSGDLSNEVGKITQGKNERMVFSESKDEALSKIKQYNRTNLNDKISLGNNESLVDKENEGNAEAQRESKPKQNKKNLNDTDDKIALENNESGVDSGCEEKIETQSKEKWQCKPETLNDEDKIVQGNNESIESTGSKGKVETKSTSNDDDKIHVTIGNNESMVDSENRKQVQSHSQSKSKRQSKKEEKAKKKEDKLKKKQVKTKSEKTVKQKSEGEEKRATKEDEVLDSGKKGKAIKEVKIQQRKENQAGSKEKTMAKGGEVLDSGKKGKSDKEVKIQQEKETNSIAGDQVLKVVRESKDTLLKVSVSDDHSLNQEDNGNEDSAEEDWEKTWNDDGECLDEHMLAELNEQIGTKNVQVVKPQFDYLSFKPNDIVLENGVFDHVVELYDFSPDFKNHDLINALSNFQQQGLDIQW
ncbi:Hypothetical predicted protein, partial [Paramuricea clavata]